MLKEVQIAAVVAALSASAPARSADPMPFPVPHCRQVDWSMPTHPVVLVNCLHAFEKDEARTVLGRHLWELEPMYDDDAEVAFHRANLFGANPEEWSRVLDLLTAEIAKPPRPFAFGTEQLRFHRWQAAKALEAAWVGSAVELTSAPLAEIAAASAKAAEYEADLCAAPALYSVNSGARALCQAAYPDAER